MKPSKTESTNRTFTLPGGTEENDLPVLYSEGGDVGPSSTSFWRLDDFERRQVAEGAFVALTIFGSGHPPVVVSVVPDDEYGRPDPDDEDLVLIGDRAWPLLRSSRYQFSGQQLTEMLLELAGAVSGVFLQQDPTKVMPNEEVALAAQAWAVESARKWAMGYEQAQGVLGPGALTLGQAGVELLKRVIDGEGTSEDLEQISRVVDAALASGQRDGQSTDFEPETER